MINSRYTSVILISVSLLVGCAPPPVTINKTFDFSKIKRVAVLDFQSAAGMGDSGSTMAGIFEKGVIQAGYQLVDRENTARILKEQNLQSSGAVDPADVVKIGKILNVDALILGEVTVYSPDEKSIVMVDIQSVTREPVLEHRPVEVVRDGKKSIEDIDVVTDYRVTRETRQQPQEYRVQAQAGAVIKMVDAQTGEIAWVGTATEEGINLHTASELVCERIVDSLQKALPNLNRSK